MSGVSEFDWELLNAYADGELSGPDQKALDQRLQQEPALRGALREIEALSMALKGLRPSLPSDASDQIMVLNQRRPRKTLAVLSSLAAALVLVISTVLIKVADPQSALELHASYQQQKFALNKTLVDVSAVQTHGARTPDLSLASLSLAAFDEISQERSAAHYVGRNGCRLTIVSHSEPETIEGGEGERIAQWQGRSVHHTMIASGMDPQRFEAITLLAKKQTGSQQQVYASSEMTFSNQPCTDA